MRVLELTPEDWDFLVKQDLARKLADIFEISWMELGVDTYILRPLGSGEAGPEDGVGLGVPWGTTDVDPVPPAR